MVKIVCWNIDTNRSGKAWGVLEQMRANGFDLALLQEVKPSYVPTGVDIGPFKPWDGHPYDRWPAVVKLSGNVEVKWFEPVPLDVDEAEGKVPVSDLPTLAAARVTPVADGKPSGEPFIVVSMYARWYRPHPLADNKYEYSDASVHRIISDLTAFIGGWPKEPRIIAAGDLNTIYGAAEGSELETPIRAQTVYDRMSAIGMEFAGPQWPHGGRRAAPTPYDDVPPDTCNVPTYYTRLKTPETAKNQLDYVFASRGFHERVSVRALNAPNEWGPSDHCRIVIEAG